MSSGLFAGLVSGYGEAEEQKAKEKSDRAYQDKAVMRQLAMSALMNDPNLTGEHRRAGLLTLGMPQPLVEALVPDEQVDTGKFAAAPPPPSTQLNQNTNGVIAPMPQSPLGGQVPLDPDAPAPQGATRPRSVSGMQSDQRDFTVNDPMMGAGTSAMPQMPTSPFMTEGERQSSAPVTQKYSQGPAQADSAVQQRINGMQQDSRLDEVQARQEWATKDAATKAEAMKGSGVPMMGSSLGMTRQQMIDQRLAKLDQQQRERDMMFGQADTIFKMNQQLKTHQAETDYDWNQQIVRAPELFKSKVEGIEGAMKRKLTSDEIGQLAQIKPDPATEDVKNEARLQQIANDPNSSPEMRQAARAQLDDLHTQRLGKKVQIQNTLSEISKRAKDMSPDEKEMNINKVAAASKAKAEMVFGPKQRDAFIARKQAEIEQQLQSELQVPEGQSTIVDPETLHTMQLLRQNPQTIHATAQRMAAKEADKFRETMAGTFTTLTMSGKEPIMLSEAMEHIKSYPTEELRNKAWTALKDAYAAGKIQVLQDNLEPWDNPTKVVAQPQTKGKQRGIPRRTRR
jgi:hypothetical protein